MKASPIAAFLCLALAQLSAPQEQTEPLDPGLRERVEVRYVILDALVIDQDGRIVPDLAIGDFELYLDLRPQPIETVDVECPAGAAEDPGAVRPGERRAAPPAPDVQRRIALVVDYNNLPQTRRVDVIERIEQMVRDTPFRNEELMLVAITKRPRVEQPFTTDREEILRTLDRMKQDPTLWQERSGTIRAPGQFDLFDALAALVRSLESYAGSKAIVLFSDLPNKIPDAPFARPLTATPPAFDYDRQFEKIATAATDARVAFYPIHSSGLRLEPSSDRLARLAVETGGRFTRNTNDLSLAYARAQRDLACRYAIGFSDRKPEQDELRRVNIKVRRPGLRVLHPVLYRFGSSDDAVESIEAERYTTPAELRSGAIAGHVFPVRPLGSGRWETALVLRFPVAIPRDGASTVEFRAKLDDDALRSIRTLSSSLTVHSDDRGGEQAVVTAEPVELEPGTYDLSILVDDPGVGQPRSAAHRLEVRSLPRRGIVIVEPMLVRPAAEGAAVHWAEGFRPLGQAIDPNGFEPVFPGQTVEHGALHAVARVCRLPSRKDGAPVRVEIERRLVAGDGSTAGELPPAQAELPLDTGVACHTMLDELPDSLEPGPYRFEVSARAPGLRDPVSVSATFTLAKTGSP